MCELLSAMSVPPGFCSDFRGEVEQESAGSSVEELAKFGAKMASCHTSLVNLLGRFNFTKKSLKYFFYGRIPITLIFIT